MSHFLWRFLSQDCPGPILSQTKKTEIVDVIVVNSVMWAEGMGKGWKGQESKDGAVATRQGTRGDGNLPP
jgi:hypothetical protein